jgi:hypothetical protein
MKECFATTQRYLQRRFRFKEGEVAHHAPENSGTPEQLTSILDYHQIECEGSAARSAAAHSRDMTTPLCNTPTVQNERRNVHSMDVRPSYVSCVDEHRARLAEPQICRSRLHAT